MVSLKQFHEFYVEQKRLFKQAIDTEAKKINFDDLVQFIDPDRNPRFPRFDCLSELETFADGKMITLGVLYLSAHNNPSYEAKLTKDDLKLYDLNQRLIRTFSGEEVSKLYSQWVRKIMEAKERIPPLPF